MKDIELLYLMEEIDRACDYIGEDNVDISFMSDDTILEFLEKIPLHEELPLCLINECLVRSETSQVLNESTINENALMGALSAIGSGLLAAGGAFTSVLTGPWGMLVTSLGLTAAMSIYRKIKNAAEKKDKDAVQAEIEKAQMEIAAAEANKKNGNSGTNPQQIPSGQPQVPVQQQKA